MMEEKVWTGGTWLWVKRPTAKGWVRLFLHGIDKSEMSRMISEGYRFIHKGCRADECCDPDHLSIIYKPKRVIRPPREAVPPADRTMCPAGHPYDEVNTYTNARGYRQCRTCRAESARAKAEVIREASKALRMTQVAYKDRFGASRETAEKVLRAVSVGARIDEFAIRS